MDFALGLATGFLLWPAWVMGIFGLVIVAEIIFCHQEKHAWGFILLFTSTIILGYLGCSWNGASIRAVVATNAWNMSVLFVQYLFVGAIWSTVKWGIYSFKLRNDYLEALGRHAVRRKETGGPAPNPPKRPPESYARNSLDRLSGWVALWPFSMLSTFIGDFLSKVFEHTVKALSGIYNSISDLAWKDVQ